MSDELERTNEVEITCTRDIEDITAEILEAKRAGGEAILTIGRGLIEAKALLAHGEWLPWLTERVEFSERSAQNFMRLAREWSNPQTLADLGASKALALLALPAEERADFIASVHVVDGAEKTTEELSSRELAQAIREQIHKKDSNLVGQMVSEGTTPRRLTDLIGSLCDLTSGSGDKGTPIVHIQGYFDNYTTE